MKHHLIPWLVAGGLIAGAPAHAADPPVMVAGIDTKFWFDDAGGRVSRPDTGDLVQFYDVSDGARPRLIGALPLTNSVVGPPTNLAVAPDGRLALVASSIVTEKGADGVWSSKPDNRLWVVALGEGTPRLAATLTVGAQPSGIAISPDGRTALVANRAGKSISVLSIQGPDVSVTDTLALDEVPVSVAFLPDGKRALVASFSGHRVLVVDVADGHARRTSLALPVGLWPYSVAVTPDGRHGLVGITGNQATSDGSLDPVVVLDLKADPPRTVDYVTAGDAVEGLVASPDGRHAAATILPGSLDAPKGAWYRHEAGSVALLTIDGNRVALAGRTEVGAFPEGIAFSPDGRFVYAGNFASNSISVLKLDGDGLVDTHADIRLPGPPAALRIGSQ